MKTLFSYGGGRQGIAICSLLVQGKLPKPDAIVIADTSREKSSTWEYMQNVTGPAMRAIGLEIEVAPHSLSTTDLYAHNGDLQIPVFTSPSGKMETFCSGEWKRRVVQRWCRQKWGKEDVRVWIGFSTDELNRVNQSNEKWYTHHFPLIEDVRMSSADCVALVQNMGWPTPPRSSCWMCPHMSDQEWKELPVKEFAKAKQLEFEIRRKDDGVYFHRARRPLGEIAFDAQGDLFDSGCNSGYCFT